ncbi:MAG: ArnT family glycosyltransferase [Candidatus Brocadiia bacterium]
MPRTPAAKEASGLGGTVVVVAAFGILAATYLGSVTGIFIINPDSCTYMGLGRSLAEGRGYEFNFAPYAKYPPVYPAILSLVYLTVGESIRAMQLVGACLGVAALVAAYLVVRARAGRWPALGVAVLSGLCGWFISHSAFLMRADIPYTFFSLLALWLGEREVRREGFSLPRWLVVAAVAVVALYTHLAGAALVAGIAAGALLAARSRRAIRQRLAGAAVVGAAGAAAAGVWVARSAAIGGARSYAAHVRIAERWTVGSALARVGVSLRDWAGTPLNVTFEQLTWVSALVLLGLFVLPGLVRGFARVRSCMEFYFCFHFLLVTFTGGPHGHERYVLPVVPILFYYGYVSLWLWGQGAAWLLVAQRRPPDAPGGTSKLTCALLVGVFVVLAGFGVYHRAKCRKGSRRLEASWQKKDRRRAALWWELREWAEDYVPLEATIFPGSGGSWADIHFFTRRRVAAVTTSDWGPTLIERIVESDAEFLLEDDRSRSRERLGFVLARYPQCLEQLVTEHIEGKPHRGCTLYRIRKERLREVLARWGEVERWFHTHVPEGAEVFPSSLGAWPIIEFLTGRQAPNPLEEQMTVADIAEALAASGDRFVLTDRLDQHLESFSYFADRYPQCLEKVDAIPECVLYRVDRPALEAVRAELARPGS